MGFEEIDLERHRKEDEPEDKKNWDGDGQRDCVDDLSEFKETLVARFGLPAMAGEQQEQQEGERGGKRAPDREEREQIGGLRRFQKNTQ